MKFTKKMKLLTLILLSLSVFFIYNKTNHNNISYTNLGDGLAKGIDCYGRVDYGYSDYVKDYLKDTDKLKNYSNEFTSKEMTIEKLHNTILRNEKMLQENKNNDIRYVLRDTDYLTITIGLNDLLYKLSLTDEYTNASLNQIIKEIESSFNALIDEIRKIYPNKIYIIGYYNTDKNNDFFDIAIKKLNKIYQNNENVIYISTNEISNNSDKYLLNPNSYYPNNEGYQVISTKIINKISKKLEKK